MNNSQKEKIKSSTKDMLKEWSKSWGENMKNVPHYKYVARPLYKEMRKQQIPPLVAVPSTFFTMDFLFHQIPGNLAGNVTLFAYYSIKKIPQKFSGPKFRYIKPAGALMLACSAPVAIYKQFIEPQEKKIKRLNS